MASGSEPSSSTCPEPTTSTLSGSETDGESTSGQSRARPSILDKLRCPRASELTRKRKVARNYPPGKRRSSNSSARGAADPKSVTPHQRVTEFPDEKLSVSNGKLFCLACREEIALKRSVVSYHVRSAKHTEGKQKLLNRDAREHDLAELKRTDEHDHPRGESLPTDQRVFRVKVVRTFLRAAVPLSKLDVFRELLEETGFRLPDRRYLSDIVPLIHQQELELLKSEIQGKHLSVVFDGTTRFGEAMAVLVRYVSDDWCIQQRLLCLQLLTKSMTGEEVARELINCLSVKYSISSEYLIASMHDKASVNNVAMTTLKVVYPTLLDVGCFSHTLDHVGEKFHTPTLSDFITPWISLFSHSSKSKLAWKDQTGISIATYSTTRWWSKWEVVKQVLDLFGDVEVFLRQNPDLSSSVTCSKLLTLIDDAVKKAYLKIELAATVDCGMPFVQATYKLEGDGPLALECYEVISTLSETARISHLPNVDAIARRLSQGNAQVEQQWKTYALKCVQPGLDYYRHHLSGCLQSPLAAFKAA